jgi:lysophospholipase L1-like esterase
MRGITGMKNFRFLLKNRFTVIGFLFVVLIGCCCSCGTAPETNSPNNVWVATWGASPFAFMSFDNSPGPGPFNDQTVRQVARISVGGDQVRVMFSNEIGDTPLTIGAASVALVDKESSVKPDSIKKLTFGGVDSITIPPGAPALSDPVDLSVADLSEVAVSIYLPEKTEAGTVHMDRTAFISSPGDFTGSAELPGVVETTTMVFMTGICVTAPEGTGVIVALGNSITDGAASTPHTYNSWPDHLAERLVHRTGEHRAMAVINEGISGNQLLRSGMGSSTLGRFDRDVLSNPGLTHIILLIGINDIGSGGMTFPGTSGPAPAMRTVEDIIAGYRQLIARTHAVSPPVKIYGATLTPFEGTFAGYYSPEKDEIRMAVNEWIRNAGEFDGVIDFDKAVQDPDNPLRMAPEYDSGDKLHPGDAGYKKMAESIDLNLFE